MTWRKHNIMLTDNQIKFLLKILKMLQYSYRLPTKDGNMDYYYIKKLREKFESELYGVP